jgi:peptidoglycan/LPS O-acetylase OafA/YrhL
MKNERVQALEIKPREPTVLDTGRSNTNNNFGILRLTFATIVLVSHAPELVDGNRSRELLTRVFGTLSFGELGVDGFFVISGFLITKSFMTSPGALNYLMKRVARIYPAFLVATVVSIFLFAPMSGTALSKMGANDWSHLTKYAALLQPPSVPAFPGVPYPVLNGAMWTIAYEFRCYLLIAALGLLGILQRRQVVLAATIVMLLLLAAKPPIPYNPSDVYLGNVPETIRMTAAFLFGSTFYLFRDAIVFRASYVLFAATLLVGCMFITRVAEPALCIFGGYLIFWLALVVRPSVFSRITTENDISYGLYLYSWPVQSALVFFHRDISPWLMFALSLGLSGLWGWASWMLVEKRILRWAHGRESAGQDIPSGAAQLEPSRRRA